MSANKNFFAILAVYLFLFFTFIEVSDAATINAASASYSDVSNAIFAANRGDTIAVPADTETWNSTLTITKGINLIGAGIDVTNISSSLTNIIKYSPDATAIANNETFEISGFTIDGIDTSSYSGMVLVYNGGTTPISNIMIHHNKFKNSKGTGIFISGIVFGVAYSNQFDRIAHVIRNMGHDVKSWSNLTQEYGTVNNFYFEDNYIGFSTPLSGYNGWISTGQGGRIAVRYNTWDNGNDELWDVHGLQTPANLEEPNEATCEQYSTMVAEYYGNRTINYANAKRWMALRGGWLLMFNNAWEGPSGTWMNYFVYACDGCAKFGYGDGQHISNSYIWNNIEKGTTVKNMVKGTFDYCADAGVYTITENRDYYNYNPSFDGTSGIGCGTLTNRPKTCTTGVAYWATNQSCSNLTGMVGTSPTTPISGTLYKCTAPNTWTEYYTPYTYPHPLRGLSAPENFRMTN